MVKSFNLFDLNWQRKISLLFAFIALLIQGKSQSNLYPKWVLEFCVPTYEKADIDVISGSALFKTSLAASYEINLFRYIRFKEHNAIYIQLGLGKMAYKIDYEFLKTTYPEIPFSITREKQTNRFYDLRRLAVGYAYFFFVNQNLSGAASANVGLRQTPSSLSGFYYDIINPDGSTFYLLALESQSTKRLITPDAELRLSSFYSVGKRVCISGSVFARYSFLEQASGHFVVFPTTASRTVGTFSLSGSCIGFSLGIGI